MKISRKTSSLKTGTIVQPEHTSPPTVSVVPEETSSEHAGASPRPDASVTDETVDDSGCHSPTPIHFRPVGVVRPRQLPLKKRIPYEVSVILLICQNFQYGHKGNIYAVFSLSYLFLRLTWNRGTDVK